MLRHSNTYKVAATLVAESRLRLAHNARTSCSAMSTLRCRHNIVHKLLHVSVASRLHHDAIIIHRQLRAAWEGVETWVARLRDAHNA